MSDQPMQTALSPALSDEMQATIIATYRDLIAQNRASGQSALADECRDHLDQALYGGVLDLSVLLEAS